MASKNRIPSKPLPAPLKRTLDILIFIVALYGFLLSIQTISCTLKSFQDFATFLLSLTDNPLIGLFIGIFVTAIIQSSSATTSLVVCLVAAGTLTPGHAIPIVMGANIGTTVTNLMVSLFHISRKEEFFRAFPVATVHDMFNQLSVIIFLPIEIFFHPLEKVSGFMAKGFSGIGGFKFLSPLKFIVDPVANLVKEGIGALTKLAISNPAHARAADTVSIILTLLVALVVLFFGLKFMVDGMRKVVGSKTEVFVDRYLFGGPIRAFLLALVITSVIQSSSVTTSFVVPLAGAGLVTLEQVFPYTLGANIGTTVTAILASLVTGEPIAIQVAFAHMLFNISGTILWYPLRIVPISLARWLGKMVAWKRWTAIVYVVVIFFLIPLGLILLLRR
ncbi:Na/Pi symporter [candidate division WOR-3 bacterium]|nr:Na/Pi symporter [candidate division WOR-3 bacterium]